MNQWGKANDIQNSPDEQNVKNRRVCTNMAMKLGAVLTSVRAFSLNSGRFN